MQLSLYFLYLSKFFWAVEIIQSMLQQLVDWCHLMQIWFLEHYSAWKNALCNLKWFGRVGYIFAVHLPCVHICRKHTNTGLPHPTTAAKPSDFWSSCLRCAWSSQNLHLGDLILFLKVFKVLFDFKKNACDFI